MSPALSVRHSQSLSSGVTSLEALVPVSHRQSTLANSVARLNIACRTTLQLATTLPPSPSSSRVNKLNFAAANPHAAVLSAQLDNSHAYYFLLPLPASTQYAPKIRAEPKIENAVWTDHSSLYTDAIAPTILPQCELISRSAPHGWEFCSDRTCVHLP